MLGNRPDFDGVEFARSVRLNPCAVGGSGAEPGIQPQGELLGFAGAVVVVPKALRTTVVQGPPGRQMAAAHVVAVGDFLHGIPSAGRNALTDKHPGPGTSPRNGVKQPDVAAEPRISHIDRRPKPAGFCRFKARRRIFGRFAWLATFCRGSWLIAA